MSKKKSPPPGMISTKKPDKPCPPHTNNTLQCLIDGGEIYCGKGKVWIEKPGSDGTLGKCVPAKTLKQNKARKKKKKFTSERIPDYIMRALQPKKSVHSVYGKLRY